MTKALVPHRDVFICFSKARPAEAKVAFALKGEIEQLGLFAFEYEDWTWVADADGDSMEEDADVDRATLHQMLRDTPVVVLISPQKGQPSEGVKTEIEELRSCGSPVLLLHWSPDGWHPLLEPPELEGLNLVWSTEVRASRNGDVAQNECDHVARQLATASWLACQLRWLLNEHPRTGARLLSMIPVGPYDPLLNFQLQKPLEEPSEHEDLEDLDALAREVALQAESPDLTAYVHAWRAGADLLAETMSQEARFSLIRPLRTFYVACEALCRHASRRLPETEPLPGDTLRRRGLTLTRLNREEEAVEVLQRALDSTPEEDRWEVYQSLALAQGASDLDAALVSWGHAIESAAEIEIRSSLTYSRGAFQVNASGDPASAEDDFTYTIDHSTSSTLVHGALRARARLRAERQDYEAAIADYTQVLADADATPRTAVSAWMDRGALYREQGRLPEAIADWTRAITAADAEPLQKFRTLEARAQAYEETGQPQAAADDYEAMTRYSAISPRYREELQETIARLRG